MLGKDEFIIKDSKLPKKVQNVVGKTTIDLAWRFPTNKVIQCLAKNIVIKRS